jgi:hypothetical protein
MSNNKSIITTFIEDFQQIYTGSLDNITSVMDSIKDMIGESYSDEDYKRKLSLYFLKEITIMLKNEEIRHQDFFLDNMRENALWQPLTKLILVKRIEELKTSKVLQKGRKFDISGLKQTYLGKIIADKLGFERRKILSNVEYEKLIAMIKKLKYEIPVIIQPTETENFFEN